MNAPVRIDDDDFSTCPDGAMAFITDMLGTGFRDKLIATMGGTTIKVPTGKTMITDDHPLVRHLGRIDAEELVELMAAEQFYIPNGHIRAESTLAAVRRMVLAGRTNNQIASDLALSERHVRRIRAKSGLNGKRLAVRLKVPCQHLAERLRDMNSPRMVTSRQPRRTILTGG